MISNKIDFMSIVERKRPRDGGTKMETKRQYRIYKYKYIYLHMWVCGERESSECSESEISSINLKD